MSALLFYGSAARANALAEAHRAGRLLLCLDKDGLRVQKAREAAALLNTVPVGDSIGTVVIGPVDRASQKVSDVLLKAVEEHDENLVRPVLWAEDLGGVAPTLKSRCVAVWSPDENALESTPEGSRLLAALLAKDLPEIIDRVRATKDRSGLIRSLVGALTETEVGPAVKVKVWQGLRQVSRYYTPTEAEIVSSLCRIVVGI